MWYGTTLGWFSTVAARADGGKGDIDPDTLMVRARKKSHLENLQREFPDIRDAPIIETPHADYAVRLILPREKWIRIIADLTSRIDYENFKGACSRRMGVDDEGYCSALGRVWHAMHDLQSRHLDSDRFGSASDMEPEGNR